MRIQETDRILKESSYSRHSSSQPEPERHGMLGKAWSALTSLPSKVMGKMHR